MLPDAAHDASTRDPRPREWGERDEGGDQEAQGDRNGNRNKVELEAGHVGNGGHESSVNRMNDKPFGLSSNRHRGDAVR